LASSSLARAVDDRAAVALGYVYGVTPRRAPKLDALIGNHYASAARSPAPRAEYVDRRPAHLRSTPEEQTRMAVRTGGALMTRRHINTESKQYLGVRVPVVEPAAATRSVQASTAYTAADPRASHLPPAARRALDAQMGLLDADDAGARYDASSHKLVLGGPRG
jgi:hypothetical protein